MPAGEGRGIQNDQAAISQRGVIGRVGEGAPGLTVAVLYPGSQPLRLRGLPDGLRGIPNQERAADGGKQCASLRSQSGRWLGPLARQPRVRKKGGQDLSVAE